MSAYTGTCTEVMFQNVADYTAIASFTTESSSTSLITGGDKQQPTIWAGHFLHPGQGFGKKLRLHMQGIISSTGTPNYNFLVRLDTTQAFDNGGTLIAKSAAITTQTGAANCRWELILDMVATIPAQGSGNLTLQVNGSVSSPTGFAAPYTYPLTPNSSGGDQATWTIATSLDGNVTMYLKPTMICSASSSSNSVRLKSLCLLGMN